MINISGGKDNILLCAAIDDFLDRNEAAADKKANNPSDRKRCKACCKMLMEKVSGERVWFLRFHQRQRLCSTVHMPAKRDADIIGVKENIAKGIPMITGVLKGMERAV